MLFYSSEVGTEEVGDENIAPPDHRHENDHEDEDDDYNADPDLDELLEREIAEIQLDEEEEAFVEAMANAEDDFNDEGDILCMCV